MNRILLGILALWMVLGFATQGFALLDADTDAYRGTVVAVDTVKNEVAVSDGGTSRTYSATPAQLAGVQKGQRVIVISKKGSKIAKTLRVIPKRR